MSRIIEALRTRRTFILKEPLLAKLTFPRLLGEGTASTQGIDAELERIKEEKRREWRAKGFPEPLIRMAEDLATEWALKMSEVFTPPELREASFRYNLPKGLEVASKWIEVMRQ